MKQGTYGSLELLAREVDRQQRSKIDLIAPTTEMTYTINNQLEVSERAAVDVTSSTMKQMATWVGLPTRYAEKMRTEAPALLSDNMNHWLHTKENSNRMVRQLDGKARAFVSDKYKRIDNYPVLESAMSAIRESDMQISIKSCDVTENKMYLKLVSPTLEGEAKQGDPVQLGIAISNSEIGMGSYIIDPFFYYLACTNGMISSKSMGIDDGINMRHLGAKQNVGIIYAQDTIDLMSNSFALQVRDTIKQIMSQKTLNTYLEALKGTTTRMITGNPVKAVEILSKTLGFNQEDNSDIMRHLIEGGDLSQYGVMNAVTRTAQDQDSYDRATQFEIGGSKVLDLKPTQWNQIADAA